MQASCSEGPAKQPSCVTQVLFELIVALKGVATVLYSYKLVTLNFIHLYLH